MNPKIISLSTIFFMLGALVIAPPVARAAVPSVTASSIILTDQQAGRVIFSKTPHEQRQPASTTKVLTAMVALDTLDLNDVVVIPAFAESIEPSKINLRAGEKYYVRDLVRATLISSANDAAEVLAHVAGGQSRSHFSQMMNAKAKKMGAKHSNFIRSSGLPAEGQYSTAHDMMVIMRQAYEYPFVIDALKKKEMRIESLGGRRVYLKNHNKMLWRDSREVIGKTGWTRRAKHCFVGYIRGAGKMVFFALLGSKNTWHDLRQLLDYLLGSTLSSVRTNRKLWGRNETKKIQVALRRAGFSPGSIDGQWGKASVEAVSQFQRSKGLTADGIVGKETRALLNGHSSKAPTKNKKVQMALKNAGYDPGAVDGMLGRKSTLAIKAFQKANGLTPDGVVGSFTWEKLSTYL